MNGGLSRERMGVNTERENGRGLREMGLGPST